MGNAAQSMKRAKRLLKAGICTRCNGPSRRKNADKFFWYCRECAVKRSVKYFTGKPSGMDLPFLKNFKIWDFQCHCDACAHDDNRPFTNVAVMEAVQALRDRLGKPLRISCGVRCAAHNKAVGGESDSRHLPEHADAVDIAIADSHAAWEVVQAAMDIEEFNCFRVYQHHVHVDCRIGPRRFLASPE